MAGGSFIGLDIGSNMIKVLEARGSNGRVEVTALGMEQTPHEAYDNGVILDAHLLGQTVKALLKKSGISSSNCVSAANSSASVVVRVVDMPAMNDSELAEQVRWETERQVPFPMSDIIMDYQKVDRPESVGGTNVEVVLAAAQQEYIDQHVEVLFSAGLKPKYIDVSPLAIARALLDIGPESSQPMGHTVVIVNIGAMNTEVSIYRDKLLAFSRSVPMGGDMFTRAIADGMNLSEEAAETLKKDVAEVLFDANSVAAPAADDAGGGFTDFGAPGGFMDFGAQPDAGAPSGPISSPSGRMPFDFSNPTPPPSTPFDFAAEGGHEGDQPAADAAHDQPHDVPPTSSELAPVATADAAVDAQRVQVFNAIAPLVAELVQEIKRSLDYYKSRVGDAPVHEVLLVGGTSKLRKLADFVQANLGIPTRVANPLQNVQVTSKNYSHDYLEEVAAMFPVSLGLAVYDLLGSPPAKKRKK